LPANIRASSIGMLPVDKRCPSLGATCGIRTVSPPTQAHSDPVNALAPAEE